MILGLAMEMSDLEIAAGIGVSVPTLRKYYFSALKRRDMQRARYELWRAETLGRLARDGNVQASKELQKMVEKRDREKAARVARDQGKEPQLGKKARAKLEAEKSAETGWGGGLLNPGEYTN